MVNFRTVAALVLALVALAAHAADTPQSISFEVSDATVTATGLTPGGAAAVLNVSLEATTVTRTWRDARADAEGAISASFDYPIARGAFVAVIDVETGRIARTSETGMLFVREELSARRFKRNAERDVDEISSPGASAMVVVVRPGVGAWVRLSHDGGAGDADGRADGRITTDPAAMRPIAFSADPPQKIKPRDVVLLIDPNCLCFAMDEVAP